MKNCSNKNCNKTNPQSLVNFGKNNSSGDGLNYSCKICTNIRNRKQYAKDPEISKERSRKNQDRYVKKYPERKKKQDKEYRLKNREKRKLNEKRWSSENREKSNKIKKIWRDKNPQKCKECYKKWNENNPGMVNFYASKRRSAIIKRTPNWLTEEYKKEIEEFYILAKELQWLSDPIDRLEVDHIIPLQGKLVSGLHVPWNLQILPKSLNASKSNKLILDQMER